MKEYFKSIDSFRVNEKVTPPEGLYLVFDMGPESDGILDQDNIIGVFVNMKDVKKYKPAKFIEFWNEAEYVPGDTAYLVIEPIDEEDAEVECYDNINAAKKAVSGNSYIISTKIK